MKTAVLFLFCIVSIGPLYGQNLSSSIVRSIPGEKRSVFFDSGIFHNGNSNIQSSLKKIRTHYDEGRGYERIVFDFSREEAVPGVYAHLDSEMNKLSLDFFNTSIGHSPVIQGTYIESFNIFLIRPGDASLEVFFNDKVSVDIFQLSHPSRLVVDIKV